jgi:hypothetical protein
MSNEYERAILTILHIMRQHRLCVLHTTEAHKDLLVAPKPMLRVGYSQ